LAVWRSGDEMREERYGAEQPARAGAAAIRSNPAIYSATVARVRSGERAAAEGCTRRRRQKRGMASSMVVQAAGRGVWCAQVE